MPPFSFSSSSSLFVLNCDIEDTMGAFSNTFLVNLILLNKLWHLIVVKDELSVSPFAPLLLISSQNESLKIVCGENKES